MSDIQNNEILADCAWFADKHRGKYRTSGPHWPLVIRFSRLYDEAVRLQKRVDALEIYIADYCVLPLDKELSKDGAKRCPFCGEFPEAWSYDGNIVVECKNESCPMYYEYYGSIFLDVWNERKNENHS